MEVALAAGELDAFRFEHSLLLIGWQNHSTRRAASLRVNDAMPRRSFFVRAMHHKADRARRISFPEDDSNLSVGHYPAARNLSHEFVDAFAILAVRLWFDVAILHRSYRSQVLYSS